MSASSDKKFGAIEEYGGMPRNIAHTGGRVKRNVPNKRKKAVCCAAMDGSSGRRGTKKRPLNFQRPLKKKGLSAKNALQRH
jgi:hypothetical protein